MAQSDVINVKRPVINISYRIYLVKLVWLHIARAWGVACRHLWRHFGIVLFGAPWWRKDIGHSQPIIKTGNNVSNQWRVIVTLSFIFHLRDGGGEARWGEARWIFEVCQSITIFMYSISQILAQKYYHRIQYKHVRVKWIWFHSARTVLLVGWLDRIICSGAVSAANSIVDKTSNRGQGT